MVYQRISLAFGICLGQPVLAADEIGPGSGVICEVVHEVTSAGGIFHIVQSELMLDADDSRIVGWAYDGFAICVTSEGVQAVLVPKDVLVDAIGALEASRRL